MCNIRKKKSEFDKEISQSDMRQCIIERLDKVILNWNPQFASLSNELNEKSNLILRNLEMSRKIMANMFIPRKDSRVAEYYNMIIQQLQILENKNVGVYAEDSVWEPASQKILSIAQAWEKLN